MKKFNLTISMFIFSVLIYLFYVIAIVFVKKSGYGAGIYYFTPVFLFSLYKLFRAGIRETWSPALFMTLPYAASVYLSFVSDLPGWEVSGFIPVIVLMSFLFKTGTKGETPLKTVYMPNIVLTFIFAVFFFSFIHFLKTGSLESALYMAVSIYSPAPAAVAVAVFINFLITTATLSVVLNDLRLFNEGAVIKRIIFDTDSFLTFPHLNLSGIETMKGVTKRDFLALVEKLNAVAESSGEYAENVKKDGLFSHEFEDGTTLAMAPLKIMLSTGAYKEDAVRLPENEDGKSFVALAVNGVIAGYYAIEKIDPSTNASLLEMLKKKLDVSSIVCGASKPKMWENSSRIVKTLADSDAGPGDIVVSEKETDTGAVSLVWGGSDYSRGDIFIARPFVSTIMNLVIVSKEVKSRLIKGSIVCSFPFAIPLFAISFGLKIPQLSAVALMLSFAIALAYVSYFKSVNSKKRR